MTSIRTERLAEIETAAAAAQFEGEIREFVRRDVSIRRRVRTDVANENPVNGELAIANVHGLLDQVSGASVAEIDRVIGELHGMRDVLAREGERIRQQLADFAALSQVAMTSMKIIADSVAQCKPAALTHRIEAAE